MKTTAVHCKRIGRATVALIALSASIAFANGPATTAANDGTIVVAQAGTTTVTRVVIEPFPAYQTGVRMAAAQGPDPTQWRSDATRERIKFTPGLIPTTLLFHAFWSASGAALMPQQVNFFKNLSIFGGMLMVAAFGPGAYSVDRSSGRT